jgi:hypothetical protein
MRLVSVRSSCGCTTPSLDGELLKSHEVGYVVAKFNTRTFTGVHSATLTLRIEWQDANNVTRTGETQIRVHGNIRGDIVFQPGAVKFDTIDEGAAVEKRVSVLYAGRGDWKIADIRSQSDHLEVGMVETQRSSNRVGYDLTIRLKDTAPPGPITNQLIIVTNDSRNPRIPLPVEGRVRSAISVAPDALALGNVRQGDSVSKRVIVRGKEPFRILELSCDDDRFSFSAPESAGQRHIVTVTFAPKADLGPVERAIHIRTDVGQKSAVTLTAYATVTPGDSASAPPDSSEAAPATNEKLTVSGGN